MTKQNETITTKTVSSFFKASEKRRYKTANIGGRIIYILLNPIYIIYIDMYINGTKGFLSMILRCIPENVYTLYNLPIFYVQEAILLGSLQNLVFQKKTADK